jgi:choline-glycine betaine transporter
MVTATAIPRTINARIGTELHHSEWQGGSWISMPMAAGSDKGINIFCKGLLAIAKAQKQHQKCAEKYVL